MRQTMLGLDGYGGGFDGGGSDSGYSAPAPSYVTPEPIQDAFYSLPYVTPAPSRVGPTVSIMPKAALDPNLRAGSLLAGSFPTQANFRSGRGMSYQRAFTVDQQEALRRRRRNLRGYAA